MGHPGNWSERKIAKVRAENAAAAWAKMRLRVYVDSGNRLFAFRTPCDTFRETVHGVHVVAHCFGCKGAWHLAKEAVLHTKFAHSPWGEVARVLTCTVCDHPVEKLVFTELERPAATVFARVPETDKERARLPPPE